MKRTMLILACAAVLVLAVGASAQTQCTIPPPGMVGWWPADGTAADIAGSNNGTLVNGATFAGGEVKQAFSLDGADDYVSLGSSPIIGDATSFTIDAWIWLDSYGANKQVPIYGEYNTGTTDTKNYLAIGNTQDGLGQRVFFDQFPASGGYLKSNTQLATGQWYHIAYTQDETNRKLYINGTLDNSDSAIESYGGAAPNDVRIGMRGGTVEPMRFDGLIDEVEIFNRALSAADIGTIYNAGTAGKCKLHVDIDIKPGSDPNAINLGSAGVIPVAILSTPTFDATTVDPSSISLAGASVKVVGKNDRPLCHAEDVNDDLLADLVCQVYTYEFLVEEGAGTASLTGQTFGGLSIWGEDSIKIVP